MKEVMKNSEAYSNRPDFNFVKLVIEGNYGLVFNYA